MNDRQKLVSPCGVDCGTCLAHTVKNEPALLERLLAVGLKKEDLPCKGCRPLDGHCPSVSGQCEQYACAKRQGVDFCGECEEFPCQRLHPAADRAGTLLQNMKVFNLCLIQRDGVDAWIEKNADIKQTYFRGKITFGQGPKIEG